MLRRYILSFNEYDIASKASEMKILIIEDQVGIEQFLEKNFKNK